VAPMRITEHEIFAFLLGAAIGRVGSGADRLREKRIVRVRTKIEIFALYHELTSAQYNRARATQSAEMATDEEIVELHEWARGLGG
jgi:hypothetical protein